MYERRHLNGNTAVKYDLISGFGVELNQRGTLVYVGEFKDGRRDGQGRTLSALGEIEYEGEWKEGKRHGKGRYRDPDDGYGALSYHGEWREDFKDGFGVFYRDGEIVYQGFYSRGYRYQGDWQDGAQGVGRQFIVSVDDEETSEITVYVGAFKDGKRHGLGLQFHTGATVRTDGFVHGICAGSRPDKYFGDFADDLRHGHGELYDENETLQYKGEFERGKPTGRGCFFHANGQPSYVGRVRSGKREGEGKEFSKAGQLLYRGQWKNDAREGVGIAFDKDGRARYQGQFEHGARCGTGVLFSQGGDVTYIGKFANGKRHGPGNMFSLSGEPTRALFRFGKLIKLAVAEGFFALDPGDQNCPVCLESFSERQITKLECGHYMCSACAPKLSRCPLDRGSIQKKKKITLDRFVAERAAP